jgi:glycerol-3-phosphate acyltransferase PlsY
MLQLLLAVVVGYLLGSLPSGAIVARLRGRVDLTKVGSHKTGATNVLRTLGPGPAAVVFIADTVKGAAAVLAGQVIAPGSPWQPALAGVAAVFGHAYSPFIGFKGGRGVTTGLGAILALAPVMALLGFVVGALAIATTRYVSLGSILGTTTASLGLIIWSLSGARPFAHAAFGLLVGGFIVIAHHDNIGRLLNGTERKLGQRIQSEPGR